MLDNLKLGYFTFQYVSINTMNENNMPLSLMTLHSNMFLLIHTQYRQNYPTLYSFTFQYVSINTEEPERQYYYIATLHSNMFLLIHEQINEELLQIATLHSNMFLLIRMCAKARV